MSVTSHAVRAIIEDHENLGDPVVQVVEMKPTKNDLIKVAISDGQNFTPAIFGTKVKPLVEKGDIKKNSLIKLKNYRTNQNPRQPLIILSVETVGHMEIMIGKPKHLQSYENTVNKETIPVPNDFGDNTSMITYHSKNSSPESQKVQVQSANQADPPFVCHSIANLNIYLQSWTIVVKVMNKSIMKEYKGQKPGKLFSILMKDKNDGEIRGTFFNNEAERFFQEIEESGVYKISGGKIRNANSRFNNTKNDLEITFDSSTTIERMNDNGSINGVSFSFIPFDQLSKQTAGKSVDICGIVLTIDEPIQFISKKGTQMMKRRIELCDHTGYKVDANLWGAQAETFDISEGGLFVAKCLQVSVFKGHSLNFGINSFFIPNAQVPEINRLKNWWDSLEDKSSLIPLSNDITSNDALSNSNIKLDSLSDIETKNLCKSENGDIFISDVIILDAPTSKKPYYLACPKDTCHNAAIFQDEKGSNICKRCGEVVDHPIPRFSLTLKVADESGSMYVVIIGDDSVGKAITKVTAEELLRSSTNESALRALLLKVCFFRLVRIRVKGKYQNFKDTKIAQMTVLNGYSIDFGSATRELIPKIDTMLD